MILHHKMEFNILKQISKIMFRSKRYWTIFVEKFILMKSTYWRNIFKNTLSFERCLEIMFYKYKLFFKSSIFISLWNEIIMNTLSSFILKIYKLLDYCLKAMIWLIKNTSANLLIFILLNNVLKNTLLKHFNKKFLSVK
jgi:hypothetical protein